VIQNRNPEARDQEVLAPIVVVVEPECVGHDGRRIVSTGNTRLLRDVGESEIAVIVIQVIGPAGIRIRDEYVIEAIAVEIAYGGGSAARGEHP